MTNILIVTYNSKSCIQRLLSTIYLETKIQYRILIFDNASEDGTFEFVEKMSEQSNIHVWRSEENLGFTKAANVLLRKVADPSEKFDGNIVLLNPDTMVTEGWLTELDRVGGFNKDFNGIVSPALMTGKHNDTIWHRTSLTWPELTINDGLIQMVWACFACVWISRQCLLDTGMLNEAMWHYGSDEDFGRRARAIGYKILYTSKSVVKHMGQRSFAELIKRDIETARDKVGIEHVDNMLRSGKV